MNRLIYRYFNPVTKKQFQVTKPMSQYDTNQYQDGVLCQKVVTGCAIMNKNAQIYDTHPSFLKKSNPKFVRKKDGSRQKFNVNKVGSQKTQQFIFPIGKPGMNTMINGIWWKWDDKKSKWIKQKN